VGLTLSGWASISAALPAEEDFATASFRSRAGAAGSLGLVSLELSAKSATGNGVLALLEAAVEAAESPAWLLLLLCWTVSLLMHCTPLEHVVCLTVAELCCARQALSEARLHQQGQAQQQGLTPGMCPIGTGWRG